MMTTLTTATAGVEAATEGQTQPIRALKLNILTISSGSKTTPNAPANMPLTPPASPPQAYVSPQQRSSGTSKLLRRTSRPLTPSTPPTSNPISTPSRLPDSTYASDYFKNPRYTWEPSGPTSIPLSPSNATNFSRPIHRPTAHRHAYSESIAQPVPLENRSPRRNAFELPRSSSLPPGSTSERDKPYSALTEGFASLNPRHQLGSLYDGVSRSGSPVSAEVEVEMQMFRD